MEEGYISSIRLTEGERRRGLSNRVLDLEGMEKLGLGYVG